MEKEIRRFLLEKLSNKNQFATSELKTLLKQINPEVSDSTHAWWINKLKNDGFLTQLGRGFYTFNPKKDYRPKLTHKAKQFYNKVRKFLPDNMPLVIYESNFVTDLLGIESHKHYIFLHVPREQLEFFFYDILHLGKRVFIKPSQEVTQRYIVPFKEAIILYPMLSEMPLIDVHNYTTLSIEGILVNSLRYGEQYYKPRAIDIKYVYKFVFDNYNVNISKLLRHAARRQKKKQVKEILKEIGL